MQWVRVPVVRRLLHPGGGQERAADRLPGEGVGGQRSLVNKEGWHREKIPALCRSITEAGDTWWGECDLGTHYPEEYLI